MGEPNFRLGPGFANDRDGELGGVVSRCRAKTAPRDGSAPWRFQAGRYTVSDFTIARGPVRDRRQMLAGCWRTGGRLLRAWEIRAARNRRGNVWLLRVATRHAALKERNPTQTPGSSSRSCH